MTHYHYKVGGRELGRRTPFFQSGVHPFDLGMIKGRGFVTNIHFVGGVDGNRLGINDHQMYVRNEGRYRKVPKGKKPRGFFWILKTRVLDLCRDIPFVIVIPKTGDKERRGAVEFQQGTRERIKHGFPKRILGALNSIIIKIVPGGQHNGNLARRDTAIHLPDQVRNTLLCRGGSSPIAHYP